MKLVRRTSQERRSGLARIDVIVVLGVAALLCAVIGPALFRPQRITARKLECMNNLRQVGIATLNFSSSNEGRLPSLDSEVEITNSSGQKAPITMSWPMYLLPSLDATAVLKNIKKNAVDESGGEDRVHLTIADSEQIWLPTFTCPDDPNSFRKPGGLSYVVNAGFISRSIFHGDPNGRHHLGQLNWDGNNVPDEDGDIQVSAATGVFWRTNPSFQPSLDYVATADGTSSTLILVENLQAGLWYETDTARIGFGLPVVASDVQVIFGTGTFFESVERPLNTDFTGGTLATAAPQDWRINADLKAAKGTRPRPSSNHKGGVNAMFCDGSARFLSQSIDPHVYVKLLTPNGMSFGEGNLPKSAY